MKKRFMLSLTALIASAALFVVASFAWFVLNRIGPIDTITGSIGGIVYDLNGDFATHSVIYPELELISESFTISNRSEKSLYLRLKIVYTRIDVEYINSDYIVSLPYLAIYGDITNDEHLTVGLNSNFFFDSDGFWYYDDIIYGDPVSPVTHTLLTSLFYDGFKASNEYASEEISVSIILEVSTGEEGLWEPLTTMTTTG